MLRIFKRYDDCSKILKNLEERLQIGTFGNDAIVGGRMRCLPGFSGLSMVKPFPDTVRDLWQLVDGSNMLNLNFDEVLSKVTSLKKSAKSWIHNSIPSKFFLITEWIQSNPTNKTNFRE